MRIAFVCGFAWEPKGTVRARAHPIAVELVKLGHEVTLFVCPYDNPSYSGVEWTEQGVRIRNVKVPKHLSIGSFAMLSCLLRMVTEFAPDVVHVFKPKGFAGMIAMLLQAAGDSAPPIVLDCDDWEGWGGWNDVIDHPRVLKHFIDFQEKLLIRNTRGVTVASKLLRDRARDISARSSHIFYVPNCLSSERIASDATLLQTATDRQGLRLPDLPLVFYAGHFEPADDLDFLCRCFEFLARRRRFAAVMVGEGPELERVKQLLSRTGVTAVYFGHLNFETYRAILRSGDIAVFPYPDSPIYRAKCSVRILDYMSLERPILTTAVGQNKEYLVHKESGWLVPAADLDAFVCAAEALIDDVQERQRLGK